jgi:hypothetical protein
MNKWTKDEKTKTNWCACTLVNIIVHGQMDKKN